MGAVAWVESPLQLLNAIEWGASQPVPLAIVPRARVMQLDHTAEVLRPHVPPSVTIMPPARSALQSPFSRAQVKVTGDAMSGQVRAVLTVARPRQVVLVDDGAITLALAAQLGSGAALARPGIVESGLSRVLGARAAARLRSLAGAGRLTLFTAYSTADAVAALGALGARVMSNDFAWLRGADLNLGMGLTESVVLGSALASDGFIEPRAQLAWVSGYASQWGHVTYLPHRREEGSWLAQVAAIDGVTVLRPGLPAELTLAAARVARVAMLPSSLAATLSGVLPSQVRIHVDPVQDDWWTTRADTHLRATMEAIVNERGNQ
ncbi:hypothetical protein [Demequina sp.]|uniref:hypothetical protein n=1 Tax=Demequina sp. TaxID=2050685 RepID=UPI003A879390